MNLTAAAYAGMDWAHCPEEQDMCAQWVPQGKMSANEQDSTGGRASLSKTCVAVECMGKCMGCSHVACQQPIRARQDWTREQTLNPDDQPGLLPLAGASDEPDSGHVRGPALGVSPKETRQTCTLGAARQDVSQQARHNRRNNTS